MPPLNRRSGEEVATKTRARGESIASVGANSINCTSDDCIRDLDLFCKCDEKFIDEVVTCFDVVVFRPGEVVLKEGVENEHLWVLHKGSVEVLQNDQCTSLLTDGDSFGEQEFLGIRLKTRETMRARTFVDMRVLNREALIQVLAHHPYERALLSHFAISRKLEARRARIIIPSSERSDDASKEKLRELEKQQAKLAQVLRNGRNGARGSVELEKISIRQILGASEPRRSSLGGEEANQCKTPRRSRARVVEVEETLPGSWRTLSDWHRQLAASPEGHRLNLWQLEKYRGSTTTPSTSSRTSRTPVCSTARSYSRCAENQSMASTLPVRPHSVASTMPSSSMVLQPPYPQLPQSPLRDPACINRCRMRSIRRKIPAGRVGQSCTKSSQKMPMCMRFKKAERADSALFDEAASSWQDTLGSSAVVPNTALPPGLLEAVGELSSVAAASMRRGFLRSQWSCQNSAYSQSSGRKETAARLRQGDLAEPSSQCFPETGRSKTISSLGGASVEEMHNRSSMSSPTAKTVHAFGSGTCAASHGSYVPECTRKRLAPAQRRLEITLRGTFKSDLFESGDGESEDRSGDDANKDEPNEALVAATRRALSSSSCFSDPEVVDGSHGRQTQLDLDALRARMGFGRDEGGATPSGRTSVPACRLDTHGGALSAPPIHNSSAVLDEGIDLASLEHHIEHHVFRILERSLRGPSRATSCDPQDSFRSSPCPSPTPTQPQISSSPRSSCPSPSPRGLTEELNLGVHLRLCQSRCGSSSAVLELILDHCRDCNEVCGCVCYPTPDEAEARLLAYFARHSLLRLAATQLPVRVILESLDGDQPDKLEHD